LGQNTGGLGEIPLPGNPITEQTAVFRTGIHLSQPAKVDEKTHRTMDNTYGKSMQVGILWDLTQFI
jgi:hypothetical protein